MVNPGTNWPYTMFTDASKHACMAVVTQSNIRVKDGKSVTHENPMTCMSGLFQESQIHWAASIKEAYGIYMDYLVNVYAIFCGSHKILSDKAQGSETLFSKVDSTLDANQVQNFVYYPQCNGHIGNMQNLLNMYQAHLLETKWPT